MCSVIGEEFRLRNFGLNYDHPEHFTTPQWRWPQPVFLCIRFLFSAYTLYAFIQVVVIAENNVNIHGDADPKVRLYPAMAYLTIWTYLVLTCHFLLAFLMAMIAFWTDRKKTDPKLVNMKTSTTYDNATFSSESGYVKDKQKSVTFDGNANNLEKGTAVTVNSTPPSIASPTSRMPWYYKVDWVLINAVSVVEIVVTAVFFVALYNPNRGLPITDVNVHMLNTVFIVVDNFISARPTRLLNAIYPIIYAVSYVTFSAIYWAFDHRNVIYNVVLDWNNPGTTMGIACGIAVLIIILQCFNFALYRLRLFIHKRCC